MSRPILVIGGGVAGSVCALRLRQHGLAVHLVEKESFPRAKVCGCCIGGTGVSVLQRVEMGGWISDNAQATQTWMGSLGGRSVRIPLTAGVAISREKLDTELLARVRESGAVVHSPVSANVDSIDENRVGVILKGASGSDELQDYSAVVLASGLNASGSKRLLPWTELPHGPFGASFFANVDGLPTGVIGMACDREGYVGVVRLEDGRVDVAAALSSGASHRVNGSPKQRILKILERSHLPIGSIEVTSEVMVTPPLRRSRLSGTGRLVAIGDASGYVEPFTGEGMTWGMMSGYAIADLIADSRGNFQSLGQRWCHRQKRLLGSRRRTCRLLTTILQNSVARFGAAQVLSRFPSFAKPLTAHLSRPLD